MGKGGREGKEQANRISAFLFFFSDLEVVLEYVFICHVCSYFFVFFLGDVITFF